MDKKWSIPASARVHRVGMAKMVKKTYAGMSSQRVARSRGTWCMARSDCR